MALDFTNATSDRVNHGSDTSLDNLDPYTYLAWIYPTSLATAIIIDKRDGSNGYKFIYLSDTSGSINNIMHTGDGSDNCRAESGTGIVSTDAWQFVGGVLDTGGADADQRIFHGDLSTFVTEIGSYIAQSAGTGSPVSNANGDLRVGNFAIESFAFLGYIAWAGVWNVALTLGQIQEQQFRPYPTSGCVLFTHCGLVGTGTQPDWSGNGNAGTVTGATVVPHVPLAPLFGFDAPRSPLVAPAAASYPPRLNSLRMWPGVR